MIKGRIVTTTRLQYVINDWIMTTTRVQYTIKNWIVTTIGVQYMIKDWIGTHYQGNVYDQELDIEQGFSI
jgi:hypothetical protein